MSAKAVYASLPKTRVVGLGMAGLLIAAVGTGGAAAASASAPPAQSKSFALAGDTSGVTFGGETTNADGTVNATWTKDKTTVHVSGRPGATVSLSQETTATGGTKGKGTGGISVSVMPAPLDKNNPQAAIAAYAGSGRSVVKDAVAAGVPADEAQKVYGHMSAAPTPAGSATVQLDGGNIIDSYCTDVSGDAGNATGHACLTRYLSQSNGADWYIADKVLASGNDPDWWYSLDTLRAYMSYSAGNQIIDWSPASTRNVSACNQQTTGINVGAFNYSQTDQICPDRMDPYTTTNYNTNFGATWSGYDNNNWVEEVNPEIGVHSPATASISNSTLNLYIHWS